MDVSTQMIDKLAHLSRLSFSPEEKTELQTDLQRMIGMVEKMQELNTTGVEPLLHIGSAKNILRKDKVSGQLSRSQALSNAPLPDEHFFKVPKVIQK